MEFGDGFRALDEKSVVEYIKSAPALAARLGGGQLDGVEIREVGDGNLNFVYIVLGPAGSFVLKQALPYIRLVGESWPMTKERAYFEALALKEQGRLCPDHVPEVYHFDRSMSVIGMRYLEPPHIILRKGLVAGIEYPLLAEHMSEYMAKTLFFTSLLYHSTAEHRRAESCQIFFVCRFCERAQALIHGDLHTSSIMVTSDSTQVIDPEFAFYGPMGYDIGAFLGNLILAYFSQDGHAIEGNDRKAYQKWILRTIAETWDLFQKKFISLWDEHKDGKGEAYPISIYNKPELQISLQQKYMKDLFHDALGFGAAKMIRRIVGIAHVEDFESIADASKRASCERNALNCAKTLLKERRQFETVGQVISVIQEIQP